MICPARRRAKCTSSRWNSREVGSSAVTPHAALKGTRPVDLVQDRVDANTDARLRVRVAYLVQPNSRQSSIAAAE